MSAIVPEAYIETRQLYWWRKLLPSPQNLQQDCSIDKITIFVWTTTIWRVTYNKTPTKTALDIADSCPGDKPHSHFAWSRRLLRKKYFHWSFQRIYWFQRRSKQNEDHVVRKFEQIEKRKSARTRRSFTKNQKFGLSIPQGQQTREESSQLRQQAMWDLCTSPFRAEKCQILQTQPVLFFKKYLHMSASPKLVLSLSTIFSWRKPRDILAYHRRLTLLRDPRDRLGLATTIT